MGGRDFWLGKVGQRVIATLVGVVIAGVLLSLWPLVLVSWRYWFGG